MTNTFGYNLIIPPQLHMSMPWEVSNLPTVTTWHSKFGSGVGKEIFDLVLAIFPVQLILMLTLNLGTLTVLLSGLYT